METEVMTGSRFIEEVLNNNYKPIDIGYWRSEWHDPTTFTWWGYWKDDLYVATSGQIFIDWGMKMTNEEIVELVKNNPMIKRIRDRK